MATGGVDAANASEYLGAGALGVGVGRSLARGGALEQFLSTLRRG